MMDQSDIDALSRRVSELRYMLENNRKHVELIDDTLAALDGFTDALERADEAESNLEATKDELESTIRDLDSHVEENEKLEKRIAELEKLLQVEQDNHHGYYSMVSELGELLGKDAP